jgi:hypothetical protein
MSTAPSDFCFAAEKIFAAGLAESGISPVKYMVCWGEYVPDVVLIWDNPVMEVAYHVHAIQKSLSYEKGEEMPEIVLSANQLAWALIAEREPSIISKQADVTYDFNAQKYIMQCFGQDIFVDISSYTITSDSPLGNKLLHGLGYFFDLAALWYLGTAKNVPLAGRMISPASLSGGEIFQRGSHVLPLYQIAAKYDGDYAGFYKRGEEVGGQRMEYGDAALRLFPFPRVPVTIILWEADEEFPARADMFFDATCEKHLPTDVVWSTAMTSALVLL